MYRNKTQVLHKSAEYRRKNRSRREMRAGTEVQRRSIPTYRQYVYAPLRTEVQVGMASYTSLRRSLFMSFSAPPPPPPPPPPAPPPPFFDTLDTPRRNTRYERLNV